MEPISSAILQSFIERDKKKSEGLLPELVKRLILSSCSNVTSIRMPGLDDVWAPGFDGIVNSNEETAYVADGTSVWECGTNADSLRKINDDYNKRTNNSLGLEKTTTTFYLVVPKIWAYDNQGMSISKWETTHKGDWKGVHIYDASVLCDWINSEPAVCAWLFEQYGESKNLSFFSVAEAWRAFSNRTNPPLTYSMFLEGRQDAILDFQDRKQQKMCRVRSDYFIDAYGFCLSVLMKEPEISNFAIVVNNENTYFELTRLVKGKTFVLSFPLSGQVSDDNNTILCYSKESTSASDMIVLPALWKTQFTKALQEMGLSQAQASECYLFTHGNLLSLIRRIPGNTADSLPNWANTPEVELLYPIIFMRRFSTANDLEKHVISAIANVDYDDLVSKYELFLRMEDAPIKKVDDSYHLVNYEEAWLTLHVDISDIMSSRMQNTIITLLSECKDIEKYLLRPQASVIKRLIYNYIYFAETGSEKGAINSQVKALLEYAKFPSCNDIIFDSLSVLAEAAPIEVLGFIETELDNGIISQVFSEKDTWKGNYQNVLWALDKLVLQEDSAIRACKILYELCQIHREYSTGNTAKESLLNALYLCSDHTPITIEEKKRLAIKFIDDNSSFGVPFAIDLISKNGIVRGVRIGEKEHKFGHVTVTDLYSAHSDIASKIICTSIEEKRIDWIGKALEVYRYIPCEVLSSSSELLAKNCFAPEEKMPVIFQLRSHLFSINDYDFEDERPWVEPLNKWLYFLSTDDPVSKEGWRFYKYYEAPFPEILSDDTKDDYQKRINQAEGIRQQTFYYIRDKFGMDAIKGLVACMEDERCWGVFLGKNLIDGEHVVIAKLLCSGKKIQLLSGFVSTVDLPIATEIFNMLSQEDRESLLPLLHRDDIDDWLDSSELQRLYWQTKRMTQFNDREYYYLLKYNPCGILPIFIHKEKDAKAFIHLIKVFRAITNCNYYSNTGLLKRIIQLFDGHNYSDEWAELCSDLYDKSIFSDTYGYYPECLKTYFFRYPEQIVLRYHNDSHSFYKHFHYDYYLPNKAFEDQSTFITWCDYLFNAGKEDSFLISTLGAILGRSISGKDGIFPHEFVRIALEKYSNDELTQNVAIGWMNARGARIVGDGLNEKNTELQYRNYARRLELEYPQTAKLLLMIASDYEWESKYNRQHSEAFPL